MSPANERQLIAVFLGIVFIIGVSLVVGYAQLGTVEQRIIETCKESK